MSARPATGRPGGLAARSQLVDPDASVRLEPLSPDAQDALYAQVVSRLGARHTRLALWCGC